MSVNLEENRDGSVTVSIGTLSVVAKYVDGQWLWWGNPKLLIDLAMSDLLDGAFPVISKESRRCHE